MNEGQPQNSEKLVQTPEEKALLGFINSHIAGDLDSFEIVSEKTTEYLVGRLMDGRHFEKKDFNKYVQLLYKAREVENDKEKRADLDEAIHYARVFSQGVEYSSDQIKKVVEKHGLDSI